MGVRLALIFVTVLARADSFPGLPDFPSRYPPVPDWSAPLEKAEEKRERVSFASTQEGAYRLRLGDGKSVIYKPYLFNLPLSAPTTKVPNPFKPGGAAVTSYSGEDLKTLLSLATRLEAAGETPRIVGVVYKQVSPTQGYAYLIAEDYFRPLDGTEVIDYGTGDNLFMRPGLTGEMAKLRNRMRALAETHPDGVYSNVLFRVVKRGDRLHYELALIDLAPNPCEPPFKKLKGTP